MDTSALPPERAADLCVFLASGRADAFSGRFILVSDDTEELLRHTDAVREHDLYVLARRTLANLPAE